MSRSPLRPQQQHPWHTATKRQILGTAWNTHNGPSNGPESVEMDGSNPDHVKLLLEDLTAKHNQIVANLQADLVDHKYQQEEALNVGLMKLPKSIRQMTVREFNQSHQCNLLAILKGKDGVVPSSMAQGPKKRDYQMTVAETPAPRTRQPPTTEMRTVRKGEGLFSVNGSPVEATEVGAVVATVTKKRRGNHTSNDPHEATASSASFEINVGEGRFISLDDPNGVQALDSNMKATAASQLKVLQDQMASLMAQLTK